MHADRPIKKRTEDKLGRAGFARSIAAQIQQAPRGESFVLGLVGAWGTGKTSILNLIKEELSWDSSLLFLWFNPWLFSGHQQLVAHFFQEISAQLRDQGGQELRDIWRGFEGYSRLLRSLRAVPGGEGELREEAREPSVRRQRELLEEALANARQRLVIVIDDLDRLADDEIRDVMRLVRLLADFPNTVYLLSYDQQRVEQAFGGEERGKAYLEKIVQVVHHVPTIRQSDLTRILSEEVNEVLRSTLYLPSDPHSLQDVFYLGIRPLFEGLRDVYRYANALRPTLAQIEDEVTVVDVMALEAIRVLETDVFMELVARAELLAPLPSRRSHSREQYAVREASKQQLFALGGKSAERIRNLITRIFPAIGGSYGESWLGTWRKQRRVAHPDVFQIYVDRAIPEGAIPARAVREFVEKLNDEDALSRFLDAVSPGELEQLFERLEDYEDDFRLDENGTAVKVVLEQLSRMREGSMAMFDLGADMALRRIVLRLLRKLDPERCLNIVERQLPRIRSLSARSMLIHMAMTKEHHLINEQDASRLAEELDRSVINASVEQLASERDLTRLLGDTSDRHRVSMQEKTRDLVADDLALIRLLTSGMSESRSAPMGSVVSSVEHSLYWWDELEGIVGTDILKERIRKLGARRDELGLSDRANLALETALRYTEGWRPTRFMRKRDAEVTVDDAAANADSEEEVDQDGSSEDDDLDAST